MKIAFRAVILLFAMVVLLFACSRKVHPAKNEKDLTASLNAFAMDLYLQLGQFEAENLFFSPLSVGQALALTRAGAAGNTAGEMDAVLGTQKDEAVNAAAFKKLNALINYQDSAVQLLSANALWVQKGMALNPDYLSEASRDYNARVDYLDFSDERSREKGRKTINDWVSEQTRGNIADLIPPNTLASHNKMVITNAVYFLGAWQEAFDPRWTVEMPFHLPSGEHTMAQFMSRTSSLSYFSSASLEMVELPYGDGRFGMLILLPRRDTSFQTIEKQLDAAILQSWIAEMKARDVTCQIPRWRTSSSLGLGKPLFNLGIKDAFSAAADFSRMSPTKSIFISKVLHQAAIDVSEKGTEASAASAVILSESTGGTESLYFRADRPFVYFIRDRESGLILFAGRLVVPEQ